MSRLRLLIIGVVAMTTLAGTVAGRSRKKPSDTPKPFDYYLLTLSWAPDFCAGAGGMKDPRECGAGRRVGFVVHGMWPQDNQGRGPENCGGASPVSKAIIAVTLRYIPTESLIQHEWATHGTCSGLNANDYFAAIRGARDSVTIPANFIAPSVSMSENAAQVEAQFAAANPGFPEGAFRATCTGGQLQEARVCLNKTFQPLACTASAGECTAGTMTILPVR